MVLVVTAQHAPQPFSDLRNRRVHLPAKFLLQFLQLLPPSFAVRNAPDFEPAQPVLPAYMLESQEGERLRFPLSTLRPVERREPPKSDQPCLFFIQLQPILAQMLLQFPEIALCLVLALEAENGVVGVAYDGDVASRRLPPLICPLIEHIVQVHVGEQRRNHRALGRTCFCLPPDAVLHHPRLQPFLDQAQDSEIGDSILDELDQLFVRYVIEKALYVQIENPVHSLPLDRHIQRIQRHMLPAPRSEPVGEPPKILFVYLVEDRHHSLLDDLVLQRRDSQWPLLAIAFRYPASL